MTSTNQTNTTFFICSPFDPYWVYALTIPFLGVLFNGSLLVICILFRRRRYNKHTAVMRKHGTTSLSASSAATLNQLTLIDSSTIVAATFNFDLNDSTYTRRPEFALNWFVANCAASTLLASTLRTITTAYLFTYDYVLCPKIADERGAKIIEILVYVQYSVFSVAYLNFLIALNMEKLLFIMKPLHYRALMTRPRVAFVCVVTWILSLAWFPLYFAQSDEDVVRWGTILVTVLMIGPSIFCLISSTILAVVVFRLKIQDGRNNNNNPSCCTYFKSAIRLFQAVLWTCVTSLPHPLSIIVSYYSSVGDPTTDVVVKIFVGYLSIAYFSGTPLMIFLIYPIYWRRLKPHLNFNCGKYRYRNV